MTKAEIISFVRNNLKKVDKTNKYHPVVVEKAITMAFNQGYSDIFDKDPRELDNYTRTYGGSGSPLTVTANPNTGIYETTLPVPYIPFSDKNSGIRNVATPTVTTTKFYPVTKREFEILAGTMAGELAGSSIGGAYDHVRCYYVVRLDKVEYFVPSTVASNGVRMDIVIPFDQYSSDDVVNIPYAKDMQLMAAVIELLRTVPPVDLKDNNADTE